MKQCNCFSTQIIAGKCESFSRMKCGQIGEILQGTNIAHENIFNCQIYATEIVFQNKSSHPSLFPLFRTVLPAVLIYMLIFFIFYPFSLFLSFIFLSISYSMHIRSILCCFAIFC